MTAAEPRAPRPAPDGPLLVALYVLEAAAWVAAVAAHRLWHALPGTPRGADAFVLAGAGLAAAGAAAVVVLRFARTRREPRRFAFTVALHALPVLALLVAGEAAVRLATVQTPRGLVAFDTVLLPHSWREVAARNAAVLERLRAEGSHLVADDLLGWVLGPGRASRDGLYAASAEGFRSARPGARAAPEPGRPRVALVGDSFTFGLDVRFEDSWGHRLEGALGDAQVLNFGVEAYGLDQAYLRYLRDARPWRPRVVVLGVIDHDLQRSMAVYFFLSFPGWDYPFAKPRFVVRGDGLALLNAPPLPPAEALARAPDVAALPHVAHEPGFRPAEWRHHPLDASRLHRLAASRYAHLATPRPPEAPVVDLNRRIVQAFLDRARAEGSRPLVVYFPSDRNFRMLARDPRWRSLAQTMLDGAAIPYVDTTPCLLPLAPAERFPADGRNHFAPAANAAVAACLAEPVRALLAGAARP